MKNMEVGVSTVPSHKKKEEVKGEIEEGELIQKENEMIFYLDDTPEYRISAVGKWCENSQGKVIGDVDTYFLHIRTGQRCESAWSCYTGWSEPNEKSTEKWETLCERIEELDNLEAYICDEESVGL